MGFFNICPRDKKYLTYTLKDIPLRVVQGDGVEINPDFDVQQTDLNGGYKHFKLESGKADSFKVTVLIHKDDKVAARYHVPTNLKNKVTNNVVHTDFGDVNLLGGYGDFLNVRTLLNYFMRHLTPLMINSNIVGVSKSNTYVITENKTRKQEYRGWTEWELVFTKYDAVKYASFKKTTKGVQNALKKLKSKKKQKVSAKTKLRKQLGKCKRNVLVYSKKKKTVACVKTLQKYLNKDLGTKLIIDGWFGKETTKAVTKYQTKYSKAFGLKATGKINDATYKVMIGKGKLKVTPKQLQKELKKSSNKNTKKKTVKKGQIGKTIVIKQNSKGILK